MKLAIAQLNPTIGNLVGNAQQILDCARKAAERGVRLVLTPELSLCGYPPRDLLLNPSFVESMATTLEQLAKQLPPSVAVLVGTVTPNPHAHMAGGKPLFNSIALLEQGKIQQIFYKRLLPTYDVFDEYRYFESGLQSNLFELEESGVVGAHFTQISAFPPINSINPPVPRARSQESESKIRIGVTVCEDLWNDEEFWGKRNYAVNPIADLAEHGVDIIVNLSASPYSVGKQKIREAMLRHSAVRYQTPIIYTNQVGGNDDLLFDGNSVAFNRAGELACRVCAFETELAILEFERETRDLLPATVAPAPASDDEEIWSALVLGVCDYTRKCGFSQVVIGLSGGIDSSLVAAIATEALGADNVLGILMPSPYSSEHSINDAQALATNLGIKTHILPIENLMQGYDQTLEPLFSGTEFGLAEENIQARIRGNLLMAVSNKFNNLLLSTGNKSEMAVGYCTLYGDMNGGLAVIADVPKTRVYSLCNWLNSDSAAHSLRHLASKLQNPKLQIIPVNILTKAPSAELKPGQVDQDSLPPYPILDDILQRWIEEHQSLEQIVAAGHEPAIVNKVVRMVTRAEFKRRQAPPGLKITDRAFGTGWRMPIASRWLAGSSEHAGASSISQPMSP